MKRGSFRSSLFAFFVGLVGIYLGFMTNAGFWTIVALILIYFVGGIFFYMRGLSDDEILDVAYMEVSYGTRYWFYFISLVVFSIAAAGVYYFKFEAKFVSAVLVGLGLFSSLTAFVWPSLNEKTRLDNADEFG